MPLFFAMFEYIFLKYINNLYHGLYPISFEHSSPEIEGF